MHKKLPSWGLNMAKMLRSARKGVINDAKVRQLSSKTPGGYREPSYLVDTDVRSVAPSEIKVPYFSEKLKQEMYAKYKQDPEQWNITALSKAYGTSMERTKAVLFLLEKREQLKKERGLLDIPDEWFEIHKKFEEYSNAPTPSPTTEVAAAPVSEEEAGTASEHANSEGQQGDAGESTESGTTEPQSPLQRLASEYGKSDGSIREILDKVDEHRFREAQVEAYEEHMEGITAKLDARGVDTSFRETGGSARKSITDDYYPALFGDDAGFERARRELIEKIEKETKATVAEDVDPRPAFLRMTGDDGEPTSKYDLPSDMPNKAGVPTQQLSRWKFAFKDLSKPKDHPTMIRTRRGAWRQANPLEEATRSWLRNPGKVDMALYAAQIDKWRDFDGDLHEAGQISRLKRERRKALQMQAEGGDGEQPGPAEAGK